MLIVAYVINFLGIILLPILAWIYFARRFQLSWKLILAGGLTFIASQIPHIPLLQVLTAMFKNGTLPSPPQSWSLIFNAVLLGLLAGIFEETARLILFKFVLKKVHTWKEGILVGLGHGGTEAVILGILAALAFFRMLAYRNVDLSTIPSIPADQLTLAKQQVAAYWSAPVFSALAGVIERAFAICLHVSLSAMVLYSIAARKSLWYWIALLWHALIDGVAVVLGGLHVSVLGQEGFVGLMAILSLGILFALRPKFPETPSAAANEASPA